MAKMRVIQLAAEKCDGLMVIELVGEGGENSVVIEEGRVRERVATEPAEV